MNSTKSRQLTVYRLVQESLTNVGKYAEAKQVEISVRNYGNHVEVDIKDDGKGFNAGRRASFHARPGRNAASGGSRRRAADGEFLAGQRHPHLGGSAQARHGR